VSDGLAFRIGIGRGRRREFEAQAAALTVPFELVPTPGPPDRLHLTGRHRGRAIHFELGRGGALWIVAPFTAPLPQGLQVTREPRDAKANARLDLQLGDAELDRLLRIRAKNPAAAIRLLTQPSLRTHLLGLFSRHDVFLTETHVEVGPLFDAPLAALRELRESLCATAEAVDACAQALAHAHQEQVARVRAAPLPGLEGKRFGAIDPSWDEERRWVQFRFQRARRRIFGLAFPVMGLALGMGFQVSAHPFLEWPTCLLFGLASALALYWYRCPACEAQPQGFAGGLLLNPKRCEACGVRLR